MHLLYPPLPQESSAPKNGLELPYAIPKELWYLVDHLHSHGLHEEGLFCTQGLTKDILDIRCVLLESDKFSLKMLIASVLLLLFTDLNSP